jgi:hypothetical protein
MASLDGPHVTLRRARKELAELKATIKAIGQSQTDIIAAQRHRTNPRVVRYKFVNPLQDISVQIGVIAGIYRAVLDQLVFALFELRNGHPPPHRSQFPICQQQKDFQSRVKPDLKGLQVEDIALIERLQPYNGRQWLRTLKLLAEEHKHRKLINIFSVGGRATFHATSIYTNPDSLIPLPSGRVFAPKAMQVESRVTGDIAFSDGTPIIDTLEILQAEVASVLEAFDPLFD